MLIFLSRTNYLYAVLWGTPRRFPDSCLSSPRRALWPRLMIRSLAGLSLLVVFAGYSSVNLFVSEYRAFQGQPVPDHSRADSMIDSKL